MVTSWLTLLSAARALEMEQDASAPCILPDVMDEGSRKCRSSTSPLFRTRSRNSSTVVGAGTSVSPDLGDSLLFLVRGAPEDTLYEIAVFRIYWKWTRITLSPKKPDHRGFSSRKLVHGP